MECPRGKHGELVATYFPVRADSCWICGYVAYPGYADNVADNGSGARRNRTKEEKRVQAAVVKGMVEDGYTNPVIVELTGYSRGQVDVDARGLRAKGGT